MKDKPWSTKESSTENGIQEELPTPVNNVCGNSLFGPVIEGTEITTVEQANEAHIRINGLFLDALGLGKFLVKKKGEVGHSNWEQWVTNNLVFSVRTASRYMLLYNERDQFFTEQIRHTLSDLSATKAHKILSGIKKREKAEIATKKETTKIISMTKREDGNGAHSASYEKFAHAIALLRSLEPEDPRYPQWIEILEDVISDMKASQHLRVAV